MKDFSDFSINGADEMKIIFERVLSQGSYVRKPKKQMKSMKGKAKMSWYYTINFTDKTYEILFTCHGNEIKGKM